MQFNPPFFCEYLSEKKKKQNQKKAWKKKPGEKIGGGGQSDDFGQPFELDLDDWNPPWSEVIQTIFQIL